MALRWYILLDKSMRTQRERKNKKERKERNNEWMDG
jgi:hypothetical protein